MPYFDRSPKANGQCATIYSKVRYVDRMPQRTLDPPAHADCHAGVKSMNPTLSMRHVELSKMAAKFLSASACFCVCWSEDRALLSKQHVHAPNASKSAQLIWRCSAKKFDSLTTGMLMFACTKTGTRVQLPMRYAAQK